MKLKNIGQLKEYLKSCEGTTSMLDNLHIYDDGSWEVYGMNDNLNSAADLIISVSELVLPREHNNYKSGIKAINASIQAIKQDKIIKEI